MRHMADIPSVIRLINTAVQILVGEIGIFSMQHVDQFEIGSLCHLVNDNLDGLCHFRRCDHKDWFKG